MCPSVTLSIAILLLLVSSSSSSTQCNQDDRKALLSIKSALGNPSSIISWGQTLDCCQWAGVDCDQTLGRVYQFIVFNDNVTGYISPSIGDLPYLSFIFFRFLTNLTGPIPSTLAKLTKLQALSLDHNRLSGPVPAFLTQFTSLSDLDLSFNQFSGSIPPGLGKLPVINSIALEGNRLTGPIPDSLGGSTVVYLRLSYNSLSGTIPKTFSSNTKTQEIYLSNNKLKGDASMLFGMSKPLQWLDLSMNSFAFNLSLVKLPKAIVRMDLSHNMIYGGLSSEFAMRKWRRFNVSYNRLCGPIPSSIGNMPFFNENMFLHNKCLCDRPLPPCK